jgi:hypothetical protein
MFQGKKRFAIIVATIFSLIWTACTPGDVEEAIEIIVAETETPSATPTTTSTPVPTTTSTPVPSTTSTPVPTATNTPVPTATTPPESQQELLQTFEDPAWDTVHCDTAAAFNDPQVDITGLDFYYNSGQNSATFVVNLAQYLLDDYSWAALLFILFTSNSDQATIAYIWEIHIDQRRVGPLDPRTGQVIDNGGIVDEFGRYRDDNGLSIAYLPSTPPGDTSASGTVSFTIPISHTITTTATGPISGTITHAGVQTFHMPAEGELKNCDTTDFLALPIIPRN